jgi:cell filamentation protein
MKYNTPNSQDGILPNLLGLNSLQEIGLSELEGFLRAEISLSENLTIRTKFNVTYIQKIHKLSLGHLYDFAGKFRDVNMSKGGFPFAAAKFLSKTMADFETEMLSGLPNKYSSQAELIKDVAKVHGELLFIHPFREGNGRTARILANLMVRKQGYEPLNFDLINENRFDQYVTSVQDCAQKKYEKNDGND